MAQFIAANTRAPMDIIGDMQAQAEATAVSEREIQRLCDKYGVDTIARVISPRFRITSRTDAPAHSELPDGIWETIDYIDVDPDLDEGLVPIKVKMTIDGDHVALRPFRIASQDLGSFLNCCYGGAFAAIGRRNQDAVARYSVELGFLPCRHGRCRPAGLGRQCRMADAGCRLCSGPFEKIMNAVFELWAEVLPERAMACTFNLDYLLIGGRDTRHESKPYFMWYDWMVGGWGARNGRDGWAATGPVFGVQLGTQPFEGQERLSPVLTTCHELMVNSGGPGEFRGGLGVQKGGTLYACERTVVSYCCDRERSITWGLWGGLPSIPHGVWVNQGQENERYLGSLFSGVPLQQGDTVQRPSAGGGGLGDPLKRDPEAVLSDVVEGYVSVARARRTMASSSRRSMPTWPSTGWTNRRRWPSAPASPRTARHGSTRAPRRSPHATAPANSTCSTSSASTASSSTGAPENCSPRQPKPSATCSSEGPSHTGAPTSPARLPSKSPNSTTTAAGS